MPYTPQQNGVVERKNRSLMETARCMLKAKSLSHKLYMEAVACAAHVLSRCPTCALKTITPYEAWYDRKRSVSYFRVFGCLAYAHIPQQLRGKLDDKAVKCIFVGYSSGSKGYRLYNPATNNIFESRDVIFAKTIAQPMVAFDVPHMQTHDVFEGLLPSFVENQESTQVDNLDHFFFYHHVTPHDVEQIVREEILMGINMLEAMHYMKHVPSRSVNIVEEDLEVESVHAATPTEGVKGVELTCVEVKMKLQDNIADVKSMNLSAKKSEQLTHKEFERVELEILQSQVDHAKVHLAFTENMLMHLKEGQSLCLAPKPYQAPTIEEHAINLEGQCTMCGEPLATPHVAAMYMLACKHKYHPLCYASLLASGHACSSHCCGEPIPKSVLVLLGEARTTTDYESRKFYSEPLFAGQRPPTSEGLDRTTGSIVVTKAVEVVSGKNSAKEMEKALMELAVEDGVNAVQKMMEQETVEEIEIDRVPPVYKNPLKYVDVEDPSRPAVLIDLQDVLIYSHFIGGKEAPLDLDANEHILVEEPPYCYFVHKDAEQFLVLACYFSNVFIWNSARLRNVERRVQRLFPSAAKWLSGQIGEELCDVANFNLSMGKQIFFKTLLNFWRKFPHYNEGNTLLIDDSSSVFCNWFWFRFGGLVQDFWLETVELTAIYWLLVSSVLVLVSLRTGLVSAGSGLWLVLDSAG
ncbi:hypothetical protein L7F22_005230 [Adiantum nelumboides]|nr:hypothetical protein [Adiantum nelumboides]